MERKEAVSLGDLLRKEIEENQSTFRFDDINAINAWPKIVGHTVASKTKRPFIKDGRMTIQVDSPPLRHELNMMRTTIAKAINAEIGKEVVKELKFVGIMKRVGS